MSSACNFNALIEELNNFFCSSCIGLCIVPWNKYIKTVFNKERWLFVCAEARTAALFDGGRGIGWR